MINNKKWTAENIPDQNGKVVIVTGSSSGIGFEAARILANKNAKVIIAVRNLTKGEKAKSKILSQNSIADTEVMKLDLADLGSVKNFVSNFKSHFNRLDILINNAGVMVPPYSKTKDGFELQMGTNHLGHFALTIQLLDLILNSKNSRIVNVSSGAHRIGNINFDDLNWEKRKYKPWRAYGDSKIANLYFTQELEKKLISTDIKVTAAHPGWTATDLQRNSGLFRFLNNFFAMKPEQGVLSILRAATDENVKNGDYFGPDGWKEGKGYPVKVGMTRLAKDEKKAEMLWKVSEKLTETKFNFADKEEILV